MKVTINELSVQSKVELQVVFTKKEFDEEYAKVLAKEVANFEAPGFRKGKAPSSMYLKKYGEQKVVNDTCNELINKSYPTVVTENKIDICGRPTIDLLTDIADDEWGYKAVVSVYPKIEVKDYYGIEAKKEEVNVTDEMIQDEINKALKKGADLETVEGAELNNGHTAVFDFCGYVDGVEFEGGKAENYELEIGSGKFIPGFEEQMIGMKSGEEKTIKVTFPEQYDKKLAGKDAEFKIVLHEIKECVLPELNDEFVASLEIADVKTVDEYKEHVRVDVKNRLETNAKNKFENDVIEKLLENNPVTIPQELIDEEVAHRVSQIEGQAKQYGMPVDMLLKYQGIESIEKYKELITPNVTNNLHYELVISSVAKKENVELNDDEYDKYYEKVSEGRSIEETKKALPKERVKAYFILMKTYDLILENVK